MSNLKIAVGLLVVLCSAGCRQKADVEAPAAPSSSEELPMDQPQADPSEVFMKVDELLSGGETNAAFDVLSSAMSDAKYGDLGQNAFYRRQIEILLMGGRVDEAADMFLSALKKKDPELTRTCLGLVYRYYQQRGDTARILEWTDKLLGRELTADVEETVFGWKWDAYMQSGAFDKVLASIPECLTRFKDGSRTILDRLLTNLMEKKDFEGVRKVLDSIMAGAKDSPALVGFVALSRTSLLVAQEKWDEAIANFKSTADSLDERALVQSMSRTVARTLQAGQTDKADSVCEFVIETQKDKPAARRQAASLWLSSALQSGSIGRVPERLKTLSNANFSIDDQFSWYRRYFYPVMEKNDSVALAAMLALGDQIEATLGDAEDIVQMKRMSLDGAFQLDDFRRAVAILESNNLGREEEWRAMALNKVKAHLALNENRPQEAVDRFREFMKHVEGWTESEYDPTTGMEYTKDMTLGFNARRIGDIYSGMNGKQAEAAASYKDALMYYKTALAASKPGSAQYSFIENQIAEVPVASEPAAPEVKPDAPPAQEPAAEKTAAPDAGE